MQHAAHVAEMRNVFKLFLGKIEETRQKDNIKINISTMGYEEMRQIQLTHDVVQ